MLRPALDSDAAAIAAIYNHYIRTSTATFEEEDVSAPDMLQRMSVVADVGLPWLVCESGGEVTGYAYAAPWNGRSAYRYSAEISVYLSPSSSGQGLGTALYAALMGELRGLGYHAAIAGISLPNPASVALHEKFGMKRVALFSEVGYKFGDWVDVGYWQVVFENSTGEGN